jgi:hypothetical protein
VPGVAAASALMASRRQQAVAAIIAMAAGVLVVFLVHLHPEGLRAPSWVVYIAASAFVFAGLCLLAGAIEINWLQPWFGIAVTLCLFAVSLWVTFGPGDRECSMSIPLLRTLAPDALCRAAFGTGALLIALFLALMVRRAITRKTEA